MSDEPETSELFIAAARSIAHGQTRNLEIPSIANLKRAIGEIYSLIASASHDIFDRFADLPPDRLDDATDNGAALILRGDFSWDVVGNDVAEAMLAAACQLRALDAALHASKTSYAKPSNPNLAWQVPGADILIVPRRRPSRRTESGAGLSFYRNGLIFHRVYPAKLGSAKLSFKWLDMHSDHEIDSRERPLGSAMFEKFSLRCEVTGDRGLFRVSGVSCEQPDRTVLDQLDEATRNNCFAVVWPELSMTPNLQRLVVDQLTAGLMNEKPPRLDLLVLGSWHDEKDGAWQNRALIIDGFGDEVGSHAKVMPYRGHSSARYRLEDIERGDRITCILTEDQIVAVLICRDFCDRTGKSPFGELDVDLILIPSHGNDTTLRGHQAQAASVFANFGTQVFVVQHPMKHISGGLGYVLRPSSTPSDDGACVTQTSTWATYDQLI